MSVAGASSAMMPCITDRTPSFRCTWLILGLQSRNAASGSPPPIIMCPVSRHSPMSDTSSTRAISHGASTFVPVSGWNVGS